MCVRVVVVVVVVVVVLGILLVSLSTCWLGRTVSQLIQHNKFNMTFSISRKQNKNESQT